MLTRITWNIHPLSFTAAGWHNANAHGCVGFTHFRVRKFFKRRVQLVGVINHGEYRRTLCVQLPISNVLAIGAPAETVTQEEFLFIHPVKGAVYNGFVTVTGQGINCKAVKVLHVNVVLHHIGDFGALRVKLGKLKGRLGSITAELSQFVVAAV